MNDHSSLHKLSLLLFLLPLAMPALDREPGFQGYSEKEPCSISCLSFLLFHFQSYPSYSPSYLRGGKNPPFFPKPIVFNFANIILFSNQLWRFISLVFQLYFCLLFVPLSLPVYGYEHFPSLMSPCPVQLPPFPSPLFYCQASG